MTMESKFYKLDSIFLSLKVQILSKLKKYRKKGGIKLKNQSAVTVINKHKVIIINLLYIATLIIIFLGIFFSLFSLVNHINFKVLNSSIPGVVFGFLVVYLGIRYYLSVTKLKEELLKTSSNFSWRNFKGKKFNKFFSQK